MATRKPKDQSSEPPNSAPPAEAASFFETYANNVNFESSVWDLRLLFSLLDQRSGKAGLVQVGSVHIPWIQAKIMAYYLMINIAFYESDHGPIRVPSNIGPGSFEEFAKSSMQDNERTKGLIERARRIRTELGL